LAIPPFLSLLLRLGGKNPNIRGGGKKKKKKRGGGKRAAGDHRWSSSFGRGGERRIKNDVGFSFSRTLFYPVEPLPRKGKRRRGRQDVLRAAG